VTGIALPTNCRTKQNSDW